MASPGTLQSRTKSRAKRLGLSPSSEPYTRGQARRIKRQLKRKRTAGQPGPLNSGSATTGIGQGGVAAPGASTASSKRAPLTSIGRTGINRVAGSAGEDKGFQVKKTDSGQFVHVYGRGKKAKRKYLRKAVAKAYGYTK